MQATLPQQTFTWTRRQMDVEDYLNVTRRHIGWIMGPVLAGLVISVVAAFFWPDTFVSLAAIRVVPPAVPERFVPTNVNVQMAERINAMTQTILSRNTLTNIIQTYDLYRKERSRLPMEDIIEKMQKDVIVGSPQRVGGVSNAAAFRIGFSYENRYVAQKVTRDLMTRFIDENIRERFQQSQQTTQFLRDQYDATKMELDAIEQKLTQFRMSNVGRLPDQMGNNLQQVSVLESRVSTLNSSISRAKQEQMIMETDLRTTRERLNALLRLPADQSPAAAGSGPAPATISEIDQDIQRVDREVQNMERVLERMLEQYTPSYPDVQRLQVRIKAMKKERDDLLNKKLAVKDTPAAPAVPVANASPRVNTQRAREVTEMETQITRIQGMIRAKEVEVERYIKEIADAERRSKEVQSRIEVGPIGAAQLAQLTRDEDMVKKRYDDLKRSLNASQMASEVEERKQGETLEVLDLPSLPETPKDPNRPLIITAGVLIGLAIGVVMAVVREVKDTSLKTLKDISAYTQFNVLGSVPLLENDLVVRRRRRLSLIGWVTAVVLSIMVVASSIYYYYATKL